MRTLFYIAVLLMVNTPLFSATLHVPGTYSTIQAAIDASVDGDTVLVDSGTYVENIDFKGKSITVESSMGPDVTIIDGGNPVNPHFGSVVTFGTWEGPSSLIEGFTIRNGLGYLIPGSTTYYVGGGIYCYNASPTIRGNIIEDDNPSVVGGGGIYCSNSSPHIEDNVIRNNSAIDGAGIYCISNSSPTIVGNTISNNSASVLGGAINCYEDCSPIIMKNVISKNTGKVKAGGVFLGSHCHGYIAENDIVKNSSKEGGAIYVGYSLSDSIIANNDIRENKAASFGGGVSIRNCSSLFVYANIMQNNSANHGGAVYCIGNTQDLVIEENLIYQNTALVSGGGITCHATATIKNNNIMENSSSQGGGGIACGDVSSTVTGNVIKGNNAERGGGVSYYGHLSGTFTNNVLVGNTASIAGGGMECEHAKPTIMNSTIFGNTAQSGGGVRITNNSEVIVTNTILWDNMAATGPEVRIGSDSSLDISYSDVKGGKSSIHVNTGGILNWSNGMIDSDPLFVDQTEDDFHLFFSSPCMDAGYNYFNLPDEDFEGDPRIVSGIADMGADEFHLHLYHMGESVPGGNIKVGIVGWPGSSPVGLWFGSGVKEYPLITPFGDWYLEFPVILAGPLAPIPPEGVELLYGALPAGYPGPYSLPMQAIVGQQLTNLDVIVVE